jgi:hypothetical protein
MLKAGCDPFAGRFRETIAAHSSLDEPLHFVQCNFDTIPMSLAHGFVSTYESSQGNALRSRERRVPGGTVLHCANRLTSRIDVFTRCLMADKLLFGQGMLAVRQPLKVFLLNFTM